MRELPYLRHIFIAGAFVWVHPLLKYVVTLRATVGDNMGSDATVHSKYALSLSGFPFNSHPRTWLLGIWRLDMERGKWGRMIDTLTTFKVSKLNTHSNASQRMGRKIFYVAGICCASFLAHSVLLLILTVTEWSSPYSVLLLIPTEVIPLGFILVVLRPKFPSHLKRPAPSSTTTTTTTTTTSPGETQSTNSTSSVSFSHTLPQECK